MSAEKTVTCDPTDLRSFGEHPAVISAGKDGTTEISYSDLADKVGSTARGLIREDIQPGDRVALLASPGTAWIIVCLALIRIRAVPVPLDTQIRQEQLQRIFEDAKIVRAFVDESRDALIRDIDFDGQITRLDTEADDADSWQQLLSANDGELPELSDDDVALLFFTSGTTGPPKGVPLQHRHLRFQTDAIEALDLISPSDRLLLPLPLHHVYPLVIGILVPISLGLPIILPHALTGPELLRAVRDSEATVIVGVPRLYSALIGGLETSIADMSLPIRHLLNTSISMAMSLNAHLGLNVGRWLFAPLRKRIGPSLRLLASGGSPLDPDLARKLTGLGWKVAVGYGLTETAPLLTVNLPGSRRTDSVGQALDGVELRIDTDVELADKDGQGAAKQAGEILARGPGIFDAYLNLDDKTAKAFTDDGWFRTGDLGHIDDDGYLYVSGRKSTMIVTASGENIRTESLEETYEKHPLIAEIGILKSGDHLVAVIFPDSAELRGQSSSVDSALDEALRDCGRDLPSYQQIDQYRVSDKPLDRTRLGKLKRHRLEERYETLGSDDHDTTGPMDISDMSPSDQSLLQEDTVRKVWSLLCERFKDEPLSPDSDFRLGLGVDSMGWLDLSMEIAEDAGVELVEDDIARIETVRDLLKTVGERPEAAGEVSQWLEEPEAALTEAQRDWLSRPSTVGRAVAKSLWAINRWLMRAVFRVRAKQVDNIRGGPLVFAPNHTSFLDPFVLAAALPPDVLAATHWGGWTGYTLRNRLFRRLSRLGGVIPVDAERAMLSSLAFATTILKKDRYLVWFPEGERSPDGKLGDLRPGIGAILEAAPNARVVAVEINGAYKAWPRSRRLPRPGRIEVRFGEVQSPESLADVGDGDSTRARIVSGIEKAMQNMR